jgi:hypothetical protein
MSWLVSWLHRDAVANRGVVAVNVCPRCFDTCISLAVNEAGGISVNWEHAWGDGHTMMHITQLLLQLARSVPPPNPSPMPYTSPSLSPHPHPPIFAQHLPFNLNPTLQAAITRSLAAGTVTCLPLQAFTMFVFLRVVRDAIRLQGKRRTELCRWTCCR